MRFACHQVKNNRTSLMVVLAGYKDKMRSLMQADPGLPRRFPMRLDLPDYSPRELASICRKVAQEMFEKSFEPDLEQRLAAHIELEHSYDIATNNGGLAVRCNSAATTLVEISTTATIAVSSLTAMEFMYVRFL